MFETRTHTQQTIEAEHLDPALLSFIASTISHFESFFEFAATVSVLLFLVPPFVRLFSMLLQSNQHTHMGRVCVREKISWDLLCHTL